MADVKSFRNRLKLKEEAARKLAVMDLQRVPEADRDAAAAVLVEHLAQDVRHRILETLLGWGRTEIAPDLERLAASADPALAADAREALTYLRTLR